jgi:NADH-quinone oxidoreductase subunit C
MADSPAAADAAADSPDDVPAPEVVHGAPVTYSHGQRVLHPRRDELDAIVRALRDEDGYTMCLDVCGVDYLTFGADRGLPEGIEPERFEVVVTLMCQSDRNRVRLRVQVPGDDPTCPSLFDVHPGSEAMEREVYDMFGVVFQDHPDLTRILMPEDWEGHPLRKDYGVGRIPVQFKAAPGAR